MEPGPIPAALRPPLWGRMLLFGLAYLVCAALGNALSLRPGPFVTFWIPSGLFVATLLIHARRHWPAFVMAALLANTAFDLYNGQVFHISILFFCGNSLEALTGAWLVRRFVVEKPTLTTLREVAGFIGCTALASTTLSATIGAGVVTYLMKAGSYWPTWLLWWSGDLVGVLLLSPLMISWRKFFRPPAHWRWSREQTEALLLFLAVCCGAIFAFNDPWHSGLALKYLMIPVVVGVAFRYGLRGATLASLVVAIVAAWMTVHGRSDISRTGLDLRDQATALQLFIAVVAFCGLVPAALLAERKQAESALQESEERYRAQFDHASEGVFTISTQGDLLEVNNAFARMHGYNREEMVNLNLKDLDTPASFKLAPERMRRLLTGEALTFEVEHLHKDGHAFPMEVSASLLSLGGTPIILCFHRDITERRLAEEENRRLQAQLQQAQKMESLGSLAGGVAHDMNNVLGAILGLASASIGTQPAGSPAYRAFDIIAKAAVRGGKVVKGLLSFARQSPAEDHELDINAILSEEVRLLERTTLSRVRLVLDLAADLRPIRGDASALTHAFMNLCVNAVEAMPENGTLTLRTRNVDNDWIEVLVEDTGSGMPRSVLEKALDPFFTTKEVGKGTGLGLSMVYSTVTAHQGQLEIQSEPGKGTWVRLRFPACEPRRQDLGAAAEPRPQSSSGTLSVLLVDDDELIQSSIQAILEVLGHRVTAVCNGEDALAKLEAGLQPDVVILDLNMPGLGGAGTLPRLRVLRSKLPVLLATGRADQVALDLVGAHPYVTMLSKPFSMNELQQHLEALQRN